MKVKIEPQTINVNIKTEKIYPVLEDLEVTPNETDQHFKSEKYGFDNITVKAVESEELTVTPNTEEQVFDGMYHKVIASAVTNEIDTNIVAENIKKDISILGVTGTLEAGSGMIEGIKQFATIKEMNASTGNKEGDLAVVYGNNITDLVVGETYDTLYCPKTIIFDTAITTTKKISLSSSTYPEVRVTKSAIKFYTSIFTSTSNVAYSSSDGITYTRTDTNAEIITVDEIFSSKYSTITVQESNYDILKQMFKTTIPLCFGGLYQYSTDTWNLAPTQLTATADYVYGEEEIFYGKNGIGTGALTTNISNSFADINAEVFVKIQEIYENMEPRILTDDDKTIDKNIYFIPVKSDGTVLLDTSNITDIRAMFSGCTRLTTIPLLDTSNTTFMYKMFDSCTNLTKIPLLDTGNVTNMASMFHDCYNLTTIPELDTSNVTNMASMFCCCHSLAEIPLLNTSNVTDMGDMFSWCKSLTEIPLLNTSNVTDMELMFRYCSNLKEVPLLNTSKVTEMQFMFSNCSSLSNESLNNILAMCTNATAYIEQGTNMTLNYIGITEEQATICTGLSNYQAFLDAGWKTGY